MSIVIELFMFSAALIIMLVRKVKPGDVMKQSLLASGFVAAIAAFGVLALLFDTMRSPILRLIDQIARQRADMELARLQSERKVLDVLTPDQRKELASMTPPTARDGRRPGLAPDGARDGGPNREIGRAS